MNTPLPPINHTRPSPRKHSPDGITREDIRLQLIYRPRKDERLSWLTHNGRFTHITGHSSYAGQVQDRESLPAEDRRSTTVPRHQPTLCAIIIGLELRTVDRDLNTREHIIRLDEISESPAV